MTAQAEIPAQTSAVRKALREIVRIHGAENTVTALAEVFTEMSDEARDIQNAAVLCRYYSMLATNITCVGFPSRVE